MIKWYLLSIILLIPFVYGSDICEDRVDEFKNCSMVTPVITCTQYNYTLYNDSDNKIVTYGNLSLLNDSIYKFEFNHSEGEYVIKLCDDSSRRIRVTKTIDSLIGDSLMEVALSIILVGFAILLIVIGFRILFR